MNPLRVDVGTRYVLWSNRGKRMSKNKLTREDALEFHMQPSPGKWEIQATVPMTTQRDLSLAYYPGVGGPCGELAGGAYAA